MRLYEFNNLNEAPLQSMGKAMGKAVNKVKSAMGMGKNPTQPAQVQPAQPAQAPNPAGSGTPQGVQTPIGNNQQVRNATTGGTQTKRPPTQGKFDPGGGNNPNFPNQLPTTDPALAAVNAPTAYNQTVDQPATKGTTVSNTDTEQEKQKVQVKRQGDPNINNGEVKWPEDDLDGDGIDDRVEIQQRNPERDGPFGSNRRKGTNAGVEKTASDGQQYIWLGRQWRGSETGKFANQAISAELGMPHLDELVAQMDDANEIHLAANYILGREDALATSKDRFTSGGGRYRDIDDKSGVDRETGDVVDQEKYDNYRIQSTQANKALNRDVQDKMDYDADRSLGQQKNRRTIRPTDGSEGDVLDTVVPTGYDADQYQNFAGKNVTDKGIDWNTRAEPKTTSNDPRPIKRKSRRRTGTESKDFSVFNMLVNK